MCLESELVIYMSSEKHVEKGFPLSWLGSLKLHHK